MCSYSCDTIRECRWRSPRASPNRGSRTPTSSPARLRPELGSVTVIRADGEVVVLALGDLPAGEVDGVSVPVSLTFAVPEGSELLVTAMASWAWLDRVTWLNLLHTGVEALLDQAEPVELRLQSAKRVVDADTFLRGRAAGDPLFPAANVRAFRADGELLLDTIGLHAFGLPDLELRWAGNDPGEALSQLGDLALYVFDHGDVLAEGDTVAGVPEGTVWHCRCGVASVGPDRAVVELVPRACVWRTVTSDTSRMLAMPLADDIPRRTPATAGARR